MAKYDVKLTLNRPQRILLDRAAKAAGLKTGPWARSELLKLSQVAAVVSRLSTAPKPASAPHSPSGPYDDPAYSGRHPGVAPLTRSFDPDQT